MKYIKDESKRKKKTFKLKFVADAILVKYSK